MLKKTDRLLLKNLDKNYLDTKAAAASFSKNFGSHNGSQTERALPGACLDTSGEVRGGGRKDERVLASVDLKASFNDLKLEEQERVDKSHFLKLPQLPVKQYDCIRDREVTIQPPDIEIEGYSKFRDKYFSIMDNQPKPFNKKLGLFTLFSDRTQGEKIMNKIYQQIQKDGLNFKDFKKVQAKHNVDILQMETQRQRVEEEMQSSINNSTILKGSMSARVLALPKNRIKYRYYNDGEFIEKRDDSLLRASMD